MPRRSYCLSPCYFIPLSGWLSTPCGASSVVFSACKGTHVFRHHWGMLDWEARESDFLGAVVKPLLVMPEYAREILTLQVHNSLSSVLSLSPSFSLSLWILRLLPASLSLIYSPGFLIMALVFPMYSMLDCSCLKLENLPLPDDVFLFYSLYCPKPTLTSNL